MTTAAGVAVTVNGEARTVPGGLNIRGLLAHLGIDPAKVAVERNRTLARKADWDSTAVNNGDTFEVVTFVGGG
jgi:thiamine biosynthesis protein ThiS